MSLHLFRGAAAMISAGLFIGAAFGAPDATPLKPAAPVAKSVVAKPSTAALIGPENCLDFNTSMVVASPAGSIYLVTAGPIVLLPHVKYQAAAKRAVDVIKHYGFDQQCFVKAENKSLMYWKSGGDVPNKWWPGDFCAAVDPAKVVVQEQNGWRVMEQGHQYAAYGNDKASAQRAAMLIKAYGFNRRCVIGAPYDPQMVYWLLPE